MFYIMFSLFIIQAYCIGRDEGWNYINLHCRDDSNRPVDWWYIYKPPSDDPDGVLDSGKNFSYLLSSSEGKWEVSPHFITSAYMIKNTLSPMFRETYSDHLAVIAFHPKAEGHRSTGSYHMVMLADPSGGLLLHHTVPGFPELLTDRSPFPDYEIGNGHLIACFSVDLRTINRFAFSLKTADPNITTFRLPDRMKYVLPSWSNIIEPLNMRSAKAKLIKKFDFKTQSETVRGSLLVRPPGDRRCLYKAFAMVNKIVLDVYGHKSNLKTVCKEHYSIRQIDTISLKFPENSVVYINNKTDYTAFAVSTAAHWQRRGANKDKYWTCTGTPENDVTTSNGAVIICVEDYNVWRAFDTLKVKEPEC